MWARLRNLFRTPDSGPCRCLACRRLDATDRVARAQEIDRIDRAIAWARLDGDWPPIDALLDERLGVRAPLRPSVPP